MKSRLYLSIVFIFMIVSLLMAEETVFIDNINIQFYKGKFGKWHLIDSYANLGFYIKKYGITRNEVNEINKSIVPGGHYFIPYSVEFLKEIYTNYGKRKYVIIDNNDFIWPLGVVDKITSSFGMRLGQLHTGIDLPANMGTPVIASKDGRVVFSGYAGGHGNSIFIEHRDNYFTRYSHNSVLFVKKGDYVKKGQIIGLIGSTGNSTGNHLHFEIRFDDIPLNPLDFLPEKEHLMNSHQLRNWK